LALHLEGAVGVASTASDPLDHAWAAPVMFSMPTPRHSRFEFAAQSPRANQGAPLLAVLTSLGASQGEAFQLQILNRTPQPVRFALEGLVVEPIKRSEQEQARKLIARMAPLLKKAATQKIEGFCLNFALRPPEAGTIFRVAPADVQAKYAASRRVLPVVSFLERAGQLHPDSSPKMYAESIKQYALWTHFQRWDERAFTQAWLDTTRKQLTAGKRAWTGEIEKALRAAAPRRWADIQSILRLAL
jgi:hypothetical protein